jgi:hypothetical protein
MRFIKQSKKILAVFVGMVMLGGCAQAFPASVPDIPDDFSCMVTVQQNALEANLKLTKQGSKWTYELYEPAALDGMELVFENNSLTLTFAGIEIESNPEKLPVTSCAELIAEILKQAATKENVRASRTENGIEVKGNTDSGEFTLLFDSESNTLTMIENAEVGFIAEISNFSEIEDNAENAPGDLETVNDGIR